MSERESAGEKWFREEKARRAREAADAALAVQRKRLDALARARAAGDRARQDAHAAPAMPQDEERTLIGRILAESDPRSRERLEAALRVLRERIRRDAERAARGKARPAR
jgi:hypothetical protein